MPADDMTRCGLGAAGSRIVAAADRREGGVETVWARQKAHGLSGCGLWLVLIARRVA
jgi:hypothetical protein